MRTLVIALLLPAAVAMAQENPLSAFNKVAFGQMKIWMVRSADKMPEANYAFRPTDSVRSFGQILGHVADAQYMFCSTILGEPSPAPKVEQTKTSKADLATALRDAFAYCDKAYDTITDSAAAQSVKFMGRELPKGGVLSANVMHTAEHYGNITTYLRIKNIVPPSTEDMSPKK